MDGESPTLNINILKTKMKMITKSECETKMQNEITLIAKVKTKFKKRFCFAKSSYISVLKFKAHENGN